MIKYLYISNNVQNIKGGEEQMKKECKIVMGILLFLLTLILGCNQNNGHGKPILKEGEFEAKVFICAGLALSDVTIDETILEIPGLCEPNGYRKLKLREGEHNVSWKRALINEEVISLKINLVKGKEIIYIDTANNSVKQYNTFEEMQQQDKTYCTNEEIAAEKKDK